MYPASRLNHVKHLDRRDLVEPVRELAGDLLVLRRMLDATLGGSEAK